MRRIANRSTHTATADHAFVQMAVASCLADEQPISQNSMVSIVPTLAAARPGGE
jgi:hypothetical protein